jgi:hypothetical protein
VVFVFQHCDTYATRLTADRYPSSGLGSQAMTA